MGKLFLSCGHEWTEDKMPGGLCWHDWDYDRGSGETVFTHYWGSLCRPCRAIFDLCMGPETCIEGIYEDDMCEEE